MKKVSVIIPVYNVEKYLDKALDSVCNQSYSNLEIVLIDDGATDASSEICDTWQEKDSRIKVVHKPNGGLSSARNAGLDFATGDYVYFLDSDDYMDPNLLSITIPFMDEGSDMVSFSYHVVDEGGTLLSGCEYLAGEYEVLDKSTRIQYICGVLLPCKVGWEAWSRVYRKEIIDKNKLRFADDRRVYAEDLYFCLCYNFYTKKITSIQEKLYYYRVRLDSIMNQEGKKCNVGRMNELSKEVQSLIKSNEELAYLSDIFPVIHFFIIDNAISQYLKRSRCALKDSRKIIRNSIDNPNQFFIELIDIGKYEQLLSLGWTKTHIREKLSYLQYMIDGSYVKLCIRNRCIYMLDKISKCKLML